MVEMTSALRNKVAPLTVCVDEREGGTANRALYVRC